MTTDTAHALGASRTFWELVERRAALTPDRPVLLQDDRTLTFEELRAGAERTAAGLHDLGVRPGTVVAWQLPTRIETVVLAMALTRLGAVQSPVIPFYRDREVAFAVRESGAAHFAVPGEWRGFDHTAMAERIEAPGIFEAYDSLPEGNPSVLPPPPPAARTCAGSTGPRGRRPTPRAYCTRTVH